MARQKISNVLEAIVAAPEEVRHRKVWLRPTESSPACCFNVSSRAKKALSNCRVWVAMAFKGRPKKSFNGDLCPLCTSGRVATGVYDKNK